MVSQKSRLLGWLFVVAASLALSARLSPAAIEVAGELFVDLDATDDTAGDDEWANNGTLDDFVRIGSPVVEEFSGHVGVWFNSLAPQDAYQCKDPAPDGLVGMDPTRSIEVWAFNPDTEKGEETMVAWGHRGGPGGTNMSFNYGTNPVFGAVGHWSDGPDLGWGAVVPEAGKWHYLAYTYDGTTTRVYADGVLANFEELGPGVINTYCCTPITLGTQIGNDGLTLDFNPNLVGTLAIAKVRVHDGVLTPEQIEANFEAEREEFGIGDEAPEFSGVPDQDEFVAGEAVYTKELRVTGIPRPTVEVIEPAGGEVTLEGANLTFTYQIPDPPPASFTVHLKATNAAGSAEATWTVTRRGLPPAGEIAVAGELFVDLDATDDTAGDDEWINNGTLDDFMRIGNPTVDEYDGHVAVSFNLVAAGDAYQCKEPAPDGLVGVDPTRSIEVWVFNPETEKGEETMVAWGHRGGPNGTNMSFNYGTDPRWGAVGHWGGEGPDLGWGPVVPEAGKWHHLVYTYDGTTTRVYADGALSNYEELGPGVINTYCCTPITLGTQIGNDGTTLDFNPSLVGTLAIAKVRVHDGVLTPLEIRHNFDTERLEFGLQNQAPVFTVVPSGEFFYEDETTYTARVTAEGLPRPTYEILEPAGATITEDGVITYQIPSPPPDSFTVRVRATNDAGSDEASWQVTKVIPQFPTTGPVHRYSFTVDASDSVGGADGVPYGPVTFQDGQAFLENDGSQMSNAVGLFPDPNNPNKQPPGAYIDLPNGIITDLGGQATFEAWVTWNGPAGSSWQRIFDFGTSNDGEDLSPTGSNSSYIFLTPRSGFNTFRLGYRYGPTATEKWIEYPPLQPGQEYHVAVVWNDDTHTVKLYLNGRLVAEDKEVHFALSDLLDNNNWLGRSQWNDPLLSGSYNEFRIYDVALTPPEILGTYEAGPDAVFGGGGEERFMRGDSNADGAVNIADAISILGFLFGGEEAPVCMDSADANDDGAVNIADAIRTLGYLFGGEEELPAPFGACGTDPTDDTLPACNYPAALCK